MDADTRIEKITNMLNSLQDSINDLDNHASMLVDAVKNQPNVTSGDVDKNSEMYQNIQRMSSHISDRTSHVEDLINNILNPESIQHKINHIKQIEEKQNYWNNKLRENNDN